VRSLTRPRSASPTLMSFSRDPKSHFDASIGLDEDSIAVSTGTQSSRCGVAGPVGGCGRRETLPSMLFLSRRRCTEDGIRIACGISRPATGDINADSPIVPDVSSDRITEGSSASITA